MQLNLTNIHHTYAGSAREVLHGVTLALPQGWTGVVGDNGCGKSTLARIAAGLMAPTSGSVGPSGLVGGYCEQDSSVAPAGLEDFACAWDREAVRLREELGIGDDWPWRYAELSCGQQKRLQVAVALWLRPDVLVMDEPTNHVDAPTRGRILAALRGFGGVGLLVSHDRELLDALVTQCACFEGGEVRLRPGNYTEASAQAAREAATAASLHESARREERRLAQERQRRVEEASRSKSLRSRRGLAPGDHDARERIGRAIVSGKDGHATHLTKTLDARIGSAAAQAAAATVEKSYDGDVPVFGERSRRSVLVSVPEGLVPFDGSVVSGIAAGTGTDGVPGVRVPELFVGSGDHIGLVGPNGTGKSTLVRELVRRVPGDVPMVYVPQELSPAAARDAMRRLRELSPGEKGKVLSVVAQLNSEPEALLATDMPSPGELRKLVLALASLRSPQLLVMDEPGNHLDLHSVQALERLLAGFPGAVVLVSHDARMVAAACSRVWELVPADGAGDGGPAGSVLRER
ncbi:MAG: ATP-binding cassette domain-containing protein [Parafannyhessea sp.]|uniref:ATP-binding cassette domain-containing protein n=1 Tax=Parafannyhessea sp. TaxID=2847324 RepID=UPI003F0FDD99